MTIVDGNGVSVLQQSRTRSYAATTKTISLNCSTDTMYSSSIDATELVIHASEKASNFWVLSMSRDYMIRAVVRTAYFWSRLRRGSE